MQSVVFFGSGPVAAKSLSMLQESFAIEAVITKPTTEQEMKAVLESNVPLYTVCTKAELDKLINDTRFQSVVAVLIDFGIIVSQYVIDSFPKGIVNSHFSLLPELRGADPISFAILEGKDVTGVSLMLLVEAMDEGPLLAQAELAIEAEDMTPTLTDKLIDLSDKMLKTILPLWLDGKTDAGEQAKVTIGDTSPTYTRKLTKADGLIDWKKAAVQIEREIRAYADWPKSRCNLGDIDCVITKAAVSGKNGTPGDTIVEQKELHIACGEGSLQVLALKPAGKNEMPAEAFLAGYKNRLT